jgi:predicted O-linked N-acetylglucosamine transferase (SPINDLY family)
MDQRLVAAEEALKAGRGQEAIEPIISVLTETPEQALQVYRVLLVQLYRAGRPTEGEIWVARAIERHPREGELWNFRGVFLRQLKRFPEALAAFDQAIKLNPKAVGPQQNRGNVLMDLGEPARAEAMFAKLVRAEPRNAEFQRQLGRALNKQGKSEPAMVRWRQAVALKKDFVDAWLDMAGSLNERHRQDEAHAVIDKALAANPDAQRLYEARAILYRRAGQHPKAVEYLQGLLPRFGDAAWLHHQLGATLTDIDREKANLHLRRAVELAPDKTEYSIALIESLERTRTGDEGANIAEAYALLRQLMARDTLTTPAQLKIASEVMIRVCAFDELDALGTFRDLGRLWAESGRHTALLKQLARVRNHEDRLELVEQHRIWGRQVEAHAAEHPIKRPPPRPRSDKIRLGFMSSDLRGHPVAYFALPLFDHIDRERFEVYCYSYYTGAEEDGVQKHIASQVEAFRWRPDISSRDAAQMIADDQLDMLIELGGTTHMNKLDVMAWRPAPKQASWLGYPHSAGLSTIDYFVCDPYSTPTQPDLLVEQPLTMPHSWLALGRMFSDKQVASSEIPQDRNGFITYGTANNPHKYSREVVRTWAKIVAATPGSKFAFIRPEGGTAPFRENLTAEFAAENVSADRLVFHTVRGAHLPFYNEVDITLDPFPLTGGTTTCEALWMGVPVVSLRGEAFFERLSYSILSNAGASELCATDLDGYQRIALDLAANSEKRRDLKLNLRDRIKASALGQGQAFARDFYDMVYRAVTEGEAVTA